MNERIKQLALQAGLGEHLWLDIADSEDITVTKKFAELIVRDCIKIVEGYCETSPEIWGLPLDILEHFNMELPDEDRI